MKPKTLLAALGLLCAGQASGHGGLADLSVYDRTEGRRLAVHWHDGRAYVVGKPGNEYQVTIRNRLREELLAVVSVDGVNVISGETADPGQTGYVFAAHRSYDIRGWRKSIAETAAFYFTALPDSYAARTGRPDNVGVIGVAVFRRKQEPQPIARRLWVKRAAIPPLPLRARRSRMPVSEPGTAGAKPPLRSKLRSSAPPLRQLRPLRCTTTVTRTSWRAA